MESTSHNGTCKTLAHLTKKYGSIGTFYFFIFQGLDLLREYLLQP